MKSFRMLTSHLVLSAACLLGVAATGHTQSTPIGASAFVAQNQETHVFAFSVVERAEGAVRGRVLVLEPATHGIVSIIRPPTPVVRRHWWAAPTGPAARGQPARTVGR